MITTMRIARARDEDLQVVLGLIEDASLWLRSKGTDQWERPWPVQASRHDRVRRGVQRGKNWIVWDGTTPAATATIATRHNSRVWSKPGCECDLADRAVYIHRLITARHYAGLGLGAALVDWVGHRGRRDYGAKWIRIDVWTTNTALHKYYLNNGFEYCGICSGPCYPSSALFQKPTAAIGKFDIPILAGSSAEFELINPHIPIQDSENENGGLMRAAEDNLICHSSHTAARRY